MACTHINLALVPEGAVGFIAERSDRECRLAMFHADGALSNTFGRGETFGTIAASVAPHGLRADFATLAQGFVTLYRA
jgi:hypothetical protein